MKFLLETSDKNNLEQVNYFRVIHDVTLHSVTLENRSSSSLETSNTVTVYINGSAIDLDGDKTWADNGYYDLFSEISYDDYYYESEEFYRIETNGYPQEGDVYYTTCDYQANMVTVTINDEEKQVDANKYWYDNGYETLYTQNSYTDYYNDSNSNYEVSTSDCPSGSEVYYTTCDYQANMVTVTINDEEKQVDANKYWYDNGYNTIYSLGNYDSPIDGEHPTSGEKYSTKYITLYIDGSDSSDVYMSPYYSFEEQGYDTMYDVEDSMRDCSSDIPSSDHKYSTNIINVYINGSPTNLSPDYTFEQQSLSVMYSYSDSGTITWGEVTSDSYPNEDSWYSTSELYGNIKLDDSSTGVYLTQTFSEQGMRDIYYVSYNGEKTNVDGKYPTRSDIYYHETVTVTIDNEDVELFTHLTFAEQGYPEAYKEVNGKDIECGNDYPVEGEEYWTT